MRLVSAVTLNGAVISPLAGLIRCADIFSPTLGTMVNGTSTMDNCLGTLSMRGLYVGQSWLRQPGYDFDRGAALHQTSWFCQSRACQLHRARQSIQHENDDLRCGFSVYRRVAFVITTADGIQYSLKRLCLSMVGPTKLLKSRCFCYRYDELRIVVTSAIVSWYYEHERTDYMHDTSWAARSAWYNDDRSEPLQPGFRLVTIVIHQPSSVRHVKTHVTI